MLRHQRGKFIAKPCIQALLVGARVTPEIESGMEEKAKKLVSFFFFPFDNCSIYAVYQ